MSDHKSESPQVPEWPAYEIPDLLLSDTVRELHNSIERDWDAVQRSACQTAAGRALWKHVIHDPLADLLSGEIYLRSLHEKIQKDRINNSSEISGVILAVRTLWFDTKLEEALRSLQGKDTQVVLLGAGTYFYYLWIYVTLVYFAMKNLKIIIHERGVVIVTRYVMFLV